MDDDPEFYADENYFMDDYNQENQYESLGSSPEYENISDVFSLCVIPSTNLISFFILPFLAAALFFRIISYSNYFSSYMFHAISTVLGLYIMVLYALECLHLLLAFIISSYFVLYFPRKYRTGMCVFVPSFLIILYCELFMDPVVWHSCRIIIMTAAMKSISVAVDIDGSSIRMPKFLPYCGYMLCPLNTYFGTWISFKDYLSLRENDETNNWALLMIAGYLCSAFLFLSASNCWVQWFISDKSWMWVRAYRDALSFRCSHYFISFTSSALLSLGGYPLAKSVITKPLKIEFPRSLVEVVIYWNIPMHMWLKKYVFRPMLEQLGKFGAVTLTFSASALLHGVNFQLAAVLLSLGFYTYVEYQLRNIFATTFNACIASKICVRERCEHMYNSQNCKWTVIANIIFSCITIFHLAYLGVMFDGSESQDTGYSYSHTLEKWSELGYKSHWLALASYCVYFLIK
ncbi:protein-serine O-palmitoleoyltransferase porcupine isoform X2 [Prorops nasuta]|uniref:protein-serine O-palmitoleoyltransferase porcupine isoform X2 n=1 Tax=Prorops nasuta TaxID=863751 RepID=UPI0034CD79CC